MELRIKEIAKQKNIPIKEIAKKLGVSAGALSQNIAGRVSAERLEDIANILCVPVKELFKDDGTNGTIGIVRHNGKHYEINSIEDIERALADIKGEGFIPDHKNIRGKEYYR